MAKKGNIKYVFLYKAPLLAPFLYPKFGPLKAYYFKLRPNYLRLKLE